MNEKSRSPVRIAVRIRATRLIGLPLLGSLLVGCGIEPGDDAPQDLPDTAAPSAPGRDPWTVAREAGADFRAVGNEPGWYLEIHDGQRIIAVTDYGEHRAVTPAPAPDVDPTTARKTYRVRTEAHTLTIVIDQVPCADVMSGEPFPTAVTLTIDGKEFRGCGRDLR